MFFDPVYFLFALPGLALSLWAQFKVKSTFGRYSQVPAQSGMSGAEAARELIRRRGIEGVRIEATPGNVISVCRLRLSYSYWVMRTSTVSSASSFARTLPNASRV